MEKVVKISVRGAATIPLDKLDPFQGELKRLDRKEYEQLRKAIIDEGFSFTIHVWQHDGKNYIIDGHQRLATLKMMKENEEWQVPELPVSLVEANDFTQAKRKVLSGISQYGKYTEKSLFDFVKENDIPFDGVVSEFNFPQINMDKFSAMFNVEPDPELKVTDKKPETPDMKSGSDGVKRVDLFFGGEDHEEFMAGVNELMGHYETNNVTDTVLEAVREALANREKAQH